MANRDEKGRFLVGTEPGPGSASGYKPAMDEQAHKLALLGMTDAEIAGFFGVSRYTLHRWKTEHPGFRDAVHGGKEIADAEVALALYKRAVGMTVKSEKAMKGKNGEIIITQAVTEIPPDTKAAMHWLQLRRRNGWGAPKEHGDEDEADDADCTALSQKELRAMSGEELQERIRVLEERRRLNKQS